MSDFIVFTRDDGYRLAVERGDVYEVGDCNNGNCIIERRSKGCDIVKGSLDEVLAMLEQPKAQTVGVEHNKTALENTGNLPSHTPRLVEAVEITLAYVRNMDTEAVFESFHAMELALAAEKKRSMMVAKCLDDYETALKLAGHEDDCKCSPCLRLRRMQRADTPKESPDESMVEREHRRRGSR